MGKNSVYRKVVDSRIFWIVVSVLAAIVLWLYVTTVEDAQTTTTFYGVQVQFTGEDTLREANGLIITEVENSSVTLRLTGSRTEMSKLTESNIFVTVDLVDVTRTGTTSHAYTVTYPNNVDGSNIQVESRTPQTITFFVDTLSKKTIEVRGIQNVSTEEGLMAEELIFDPATVTIRGPAEALAQVEYALVTIERDNVDRTISANVSYTLVDADYNPVENSYITLDTETVNFTLPVVSVKEVPLSVDLVAGAGASTENVRVNVNPASVQISGEADILAGINRIVLDIVDLSEFASGFERTYTIPFPNDVENLSGVTEATVTLEILGLSTAKYTVTNIEIINVTDGFIAESVTQSVEVTVRAPEEILELIAANNIRVVADLSDIGNTTGRITAPAKVYIDGYSEAGAIGNYSVVVSVSQSDD